MFLCPAYKQFSIAGIKLRPESYNTLLFLCAGGDQWMQRFQHLPVPWFLVRSEKPEAERQAAAADKGASSVQKVTC